MMDLKVFVSKPLTLLVVLVLLWRDNIKSFLFMLHHHETLSTGLSNNLQILEVCLINVYRDVNVMHLFA
jgi:hypothetical protein